MAFVSSSDSLSFFDLSAGLPNNIPAIRYNAHVYTSHHKSGFLMLDGTKQSHELMVFILKKWRRMPLFMICSSVGTKMTPMLLRVESASNKRLPCLPKFSRRACHTSLIKGIRRERR